MVDQKRENHYQVRLENLCRVQHGVVSASQATSCGASPAYQARSGRWDRMLPGVYRLSAFPRTWHQDLMAAVLAGGDGTLVSHMAAGALHGLEGVTRQAVEVTMARRRGARSLPGVIVHRSPHLERVDMDKVDRVPVTTVTRTLIDLGAVADRDTLERAVESALRSRQTSTRLLRQRLASVGAKGRAGTATLRMVLADRLDAPPTGSELETRFVQLCRRAGLPTPLRQHAVVTGGGLPRCDFAFERARVLVELDGYATHGSPADHRRDLRRQNAILLARQGWVLLRYSWDDVVHHPADVVADLREALSIHVPVR